jgi:hypothetical protein
VEGERTRKPVATGIDATEQERRDQEVVRANRELAAYFRGLRTEREARGALKIIKAFIRERERLEPGRRRPFPGTHRTSTSTQKSTKRAARKKPQRPQPMSAEKPPVVPPHE